MNAFSGAGRTCFFTSVSRQYFAKARILGRTLKRHNPAAFLVVVCVGELPPEFQLGTEPFDAVLRVEDLGFANPNALCFKYNVTELCTAVKAAASLKLMDAFGAEKVIYLDPDIAVFDSLAPLDGWLDETSILLTPHQTVPELDRFFVVNGEILFLKRGAFNAGFFGVRNDDTGRRFLSWWHERLMQYCLDDGDEYMELQGQHRLLGLFTDQKWFDLVPCFFERHRIIYDPGYNVATWNLSRHAFTRSDAGTYEVDGHPLRFFHFSGVDSGAHAEVLDIVIQSNPRARDAIALSEWYAVELERQGNSALLRLPYTYSDYSDGEPVPGVHRRIYAVDQEAQRRFANPFSVAPAPAYREWVQERLSPASVARIARQRQRIATLRASSFYRWAIRTRWAHRIILAIRNRGGLMAKGSEAGAYARPHGGGTTSLEATAAVGAEAVDVSVVIPAYRGSDTIADCLKSIQRATAHRSAEIIVVESSGDGAAGIIRTRFPDVVVIESPQRLTAGAARNRGMLAARGRLVFCVDQDCVVPPDWVDRLERHLLDPGVGAAGGSVGIADPGNLSGAAVYFLEFFRHLPANTPAVRHANFLVGCNSAYRAEVLEDLQVPDRTLGEDVVFSHSIRARGWAVVYDPQVEVRHRNRQGWGEFFRYNRAMGRAAARYHTEIGGSWASLFLKWPVLAYAAPTVILPTVAWRLARSRWSYLATFLLLSPMCLLGNLVWAHAFRRQVLEDRKGPRNGDGR